MNALNENKKNALLHSAASCRQHYGESFLLNTVIFQKEGMESIELLINAGANVSTCDSTGKTALHFLADIDHLAGVKFLLQKNSPINVFDSKGRNALMSQFGSSGQEVEQLLLVAGESMRKFPISCNVPVTPDRGSTSRLSKFSAFRRQFRSQESMYTHTPEVFDPIDCYGWCERRREGVPTLKEICRELIRRKLLGANRNRSLFQAANSLRLPCVLKSYILFDMSLD